MAHAARLILLVAVCFGLVSAKAQATATDNSLYFRGIYCETSKHGSVGCTLVSGKGYSVVISQRSVAVMRNTNGHFVFFRSQ